MQSSVLDLETKLTDELVRLLDARLDCLTQEYGDPLSTDLRDYCEFMEHATGLGFVALQAYATAVYGLLAVPKAGALEAGPRHSGGSTYVAIVNAVANYWKHHNEWHLERSSKRRLAVEKEFEQVGFPVNSEWPLSGILAELSSPNAASFAAVMRKLQEWRSAIQPEPPNSAYMDSSRK